MTSLSLDAQILDTGGATQIDARLQATRPISSEAVDAM